MKRSWILGAVLMLAAGQWTGAPVRAEDKSGANDTDKLARLEALLKAQQDQIEKLQSQVQAAQSQDQDAARLEVMRQQIREILSEQEFRESLMPSVLQAGYDDGFFIRSSDDQFSLKLNGLMQFRWTHYGTQASNRYRNPGFQRNDRTGFDIQRMRLAIRGHLYEPELTYRIEFQSEAPDSYNARLRYAYVNYKFAEEFQVLAGMFKIAATHAQMESPVGYQMVDLPMPDAVFSLGRGLGMRFWGRLFEKRLIYYLDVVNAFNSTTNRTITPDPAEMDSNPGIVFKLIWHALGEEPGKDTQYNPDLEFHTAPALHFGFHYAFNEDEGDRGTLSIPFNMPRIYRTGGFGLTSTNGTQIHQFGFDSVFKWQGFSLNGEYWFRIVDPRRAGRMPFTPLWLATQDGSTTVMHGAYLQGGYFLPIPGMEKKLELVARVGGVSTNAGGQEGSWEYAGGLNYYLQGHKVKIQTDVAKIYEAPISGNSYSLANVNDDALVWRIQLQVAF